MSPAILLVEIVPDLLILHALLALALTFCGTDHVLRFVLLAILKLSL